ncbi:MAG: hypothetical protein ACE5LU_05470 [Anaerolineae bacterium]
MSGSKKFDIPEAELRALYLDQQLSLAAIAEIHGCSPGTVRNELIRKGIPLRSPIEAAESQRIKLSKSHLEELYLHQQMSGPEIAYDKNIILKSHAKLAALGIKFPKPYIDRKQGTVSCRRRGGIYHQDRWLLETKRKASLLQLFKRIEPYLKHAKRRRDMMKAIENIRWRNEKYGNLNR